MNIQFNIETFISIASITISCVGSYSILKIHWKKYGLLFLTSGFVGIILCYIFIKIGFYSFPFRLFPKISSMPFETIATSFPFLVLVGVRYSPRLWPFKFVFYWGLVNTGMLVETLLLLNTSLIEYNWKWDFWDSYTWWWIFFILFEWLGGIIIPSHLRNPIDSESFRYGKWAFIVYHFIFILTIFLGGYYLGTIRK